VKPGQVQRVSTCAADWLEAKIGSFEIIDKLKKCGGLKGLPGCFNMYKNLVIALGVNSCSSTKGSNANLGEWGGTKAWKVDGRFYFFFSIFICFIFSPMAVRVMYCPRTLTGPSLRILLARETLSKTTWPYTTSLTGLLCT